MKEGQRDIPAHRMVTAKLALVVESRAYKRCQVVESETNIVKEQSKHVVEDKRQNHAE